MLLLPVLNIPAPQPIPTAALPALMPGLRTGQPGNARYKHETPAQCAGAKGCLDMLGIAHCIIRCITYGSRVLRDIPA